MQNSELRNNLEKLQEVVVEALATLSHIEAIDEVPAAFKTDQLYVVFANAYGHRLAVATHEVDQNLKHVVVGTKEK